MEQNLQIERLDIVKIQLLSISINRFNAIPIRILASILIGTDKLILKFIQKCEEHRKPEPS